MRRAVFLDRDGVINEERHYVHRVEDFYLLPGVPEAMAKLKVAGWLLVVVTNQAGVARGLYSEDAVAALHQHLHGLLQPFNAQPDAIYHCPHHPDGTVPGYAARCACRKPQPGMLLQAAQNLGIDLAASALVGDKASDLAAAQAAGVGQRLLVLSGHKPAADALALAHHVHAGLLEAVEHLLASPFQALKRLTESNAP